MKIRKIDEKYIFFAETKDENEILINLSDLGYYEEFRRCIKTGLEHDCEGAKNLITLLKYITDVFIYGTTFSFENIV